jgi:hypothetical protein
MACISLFIHHKTIPVIFRATQAIQVAKELGKPPLVFP